MLRAKRHAAKQPADVERRGGERRKYRELAEGSGERKCDDQRRMTEDGDIRAHGCADAHDPGRAEAAPSRPNANNMRGVLRMSLPIHPTITRPVPATMNARMAGLTRPIASASGEVDAASAEPRMP